MAEAGGDPETDADRLRRGLRRGWFFSAIWLVYLFDPVRTIVESDVSVARRATALLSLVLFAATYLLSFAEFRSRIAKGPIASPSRQWMLLGALVILLVPAAPVARESILAGGVYIAVMAVFTLPLAQAAVVIAASAAAFVVLPRIVPGWSADDGTVLSLLVASLAAWGVGQLIVRNIELQRARQRIADLAVVEERERLGRDVHDILGHTLTVITVKAELAGRLVDLDPLRATREIAEVEALARTALSDVRATVGGLRTVTLDVELIHARTALDAAGIDLVLIGAATDAESNFREVFAWTVRESVTNVVRHSGASRCCITVEPSRIEIVDDGKGSDPGDDTGNGLRGLRHRADRAGTVLTAGAAGGGFRVIVEAP
ncbi:two-component sensor histidine kinase [Rhodococcoides trifolii]|uniref:Two-component sensor histidine kinase n=2 Tax=Rhodococcoides trifolii TaxID=908250 RepID=A0A917FT91_9NOCA|nr:two-component sensor histidine kinase [Rhodococcus trifolii]